MSDAHQGQRVAAYFETIGKHLPRAEQRACFATYAFGILGDGDRKSVEPIAARASPEPQEACKTHDRLLHFVRESPWSDGAVRLEAARYAVEALAAREPVTTWVIDDTGFLKQGKHSPGVQRQYTGSAGKVANCQIGVSLCVATRTEQVPIDFELYLPESWASDPERREKARIPESITFKTKVDLALEMIQRAAENGIPGDVVLADAFYGRSHEFRDTIRLHGFDYAVATDADTTVWLLDGRGRLRSEAIGARELGLELGLRSFRRLTWRAGSRTELASRFCFRRVITAQREGIPAAQREREWLVIEWPEGEDKPTKFFLTTLPRRMTKKQIVRTIKERWKTERAYEELKGELGLDHYEGRSFVGWHHHVSVVLCCYAFIVAERVQRFSPPTRRTGRSRPFDVAA